MKLKLNAAVNDFSPCEKNKNEENEPKDKK